jgi:hypothetical protein
MISLFRRTMISRNLRAALQPKSCWQRITPFPGRFCRKLLCFDDFTASDHLEVQENKEFAYKIWGGVPRDLKHIAVANLPSPRSGADLLLLAEAGCPLGAFLFLRFAARGESQILKGHDFSRAVSVAESRGL